MTDEYDNNDVELYLDSNSRSSGELADTELETNQRRYSRHFTLSPETTDYDSNCGDLDSLSNEMNGCGLNSSGGMIAGLSSTGQIIPDFARLYTSMPVLEDGLSSGHASDTENNNPNPLVSSMLGSSSNCVNFRGIAKNGSLENSHNQVRQSAATNIFESNRNMSPCPVSAAINPSPINSNSMANATMATQSNSNIDLVDVLSATIETNSCADIATIVATTKIDVAKKPDNFGIGILDVQQQQQVVQQTHQKEDNRIDSKSYLDSDITSIFSNGEQLMIISFYRFI